MVVVVVLLVLLVLVLLVVLMVPQERQISICVCGISGVLSGVRVESEWGPSGVQVGS